MTARWISLAVMGSIVGSVVSVAVSGIFLGLALVLWSIQAFRERRILLRFPPFGFLVLGFVACVLLSILLSQDMRVSAPYLLKLIKLSLIGLVFTYLTRRDVQWTLGVILTLAGLSAFYGLLQYFWLLDVNLLNRIDGLMSHWMTFAGQLMLAIVCLSSLLLFWRDKDSGKARLIALGLLLLCSAALLLSLTRSAWLGALAGIGVLLVIHNWKWLLPAVAALALTFVILPMSFRDRLADSFSLRDTTTRGRLELLTAGGKMVLAHPLTGVGPRMVPRLASKYRSSNEYPAWIYQHLHNSSLQIAAEMGLLALLFWTGIWVFVARDYLHMMGRLREDSFAYCMAVNGLGVITAFLLAGLFEYNFGDSEILTLLLFLITAPYVTDPYTTPSA